MKAETQKMIRKVHSVGTAMVITIHPDLVRQFGIDSLTFMEEIPTADGILLKPRRLSV